MGSGGEIYTLRVEQFLIPFIQNVSRDPSSSPRRYSHLCRFFLGKFFIFIFIWDIIIEWTFLEQGYDLGKKLVYSANPNREAPALTTTEITAAGFFSAVPQAFIAAPVERAKVVLQVQGQGNALPTGRQYNGLFDVVKGLYKEGGIRSIFRGTFATLARDSPGSAAYFAAYEVAKKGLTPKGKEPGDLNLGAIIVAGGLAGVMMWSIAIPPDVVKSRLQSAPQGKYNGFLDCGRKTIQSDGITALWKGFGPAMARVSVRLVSET